MHRYEPGCTCNIWHGWIEVYDPDCPIHGTRD